MPYMNVEKSGCYTLDGSRFSSSSSCAKLDASRSAVSPPIRAALALRKCEREKKNC